MFLLISIFKSFLNYRIRKMKKKIFTFKSNLFKFYIRWTASKTRRHDFDIGFLLLF